MKALISKQETVLAQIGLGVRSMSFFLAVIFLKVAEGVSKTAKALTEVREEWEARGERAKG